jgi:hypothetical protein
MTSTVPTGAEAQVRLLMDEKVAAMRVKDADAVVAQYAPDAHEHSSRRSTWTDRSTPPST